MRSIPCSECEMLSGNICLAHEEAKKVLGRPIPPPPIGACTIAIVKSYKNEIKAGMSVLEIGCGTWDAIKKHFESVGAEYEGIDTQEFYYGKASVATRIENLAELSYPEKNFDLVIGNQTMEHWAEFSCSTEWGLYQCFRVCKDGGRVFLNVPIFFHGVKPFLTGNFECIKKLFEIYSSKIEIIKYAENPKPFPPFFVYKNYWALRNKHAFIIDIRAVKEQMPLKVNRPLFDNTKILRYLSYPLSLLLYKVFVKLGLMKLDKAPE